MALAIRYELSDINLPGLKVKTGEIDFDSSYPAGGETWDLSTEFSRLKAVFIETKGGYVFELTGLDDPATAKVKAFSAIKKYTATHDAASLAASTARDDAITVTGVASDDMCIGWQGPAGQENDLSIQHARVTAANEITVRLANVDDLVAIDAASGTYTFYVAKKNGAMTEVANTSDLSGLTKVKFIAFGTK